MDSVSSPVKIGPSSPKRGCYSHDWDKCIICQDVSEEPTIIMRTVGKNTLVNAMEKRRDDVCGRVLREVFSFDNINSEDVKVLYHRTCYKTYTSKQNCSIFPAEVSTVCKDSTLCQTGAQTSIFTRSQISNFQWHLCFICQKKTYKKDSALYNIESEDRIQQIRQSAVAYGENRIIQLSEHADFSKHGKYHKGCMTKVLLKKSKCKTNLNNEDTGLYHDKAFKSLTEEINDDLFVKQTVFSLSELLVKYKSFLPADIAKTYATRKLKERLLRFYGDKVNIQSQRGQGKSSLVFSSEISAGAAVAEADKIKTKLQSSVEEIECFSACENTVNEEHILHSAAGIIRREILKFDIPKESYPSASEVSIASSLDSLPKLLVSFITWLIDGKSFETASDPYVVPTDKIRKSLGIAECIVSVSKQYFTSFHIGLAIQLYHEFGSRSLIDTLNSHGFCASYDEVRRFITSIAHHEIDKIQNDVYVPDGIVHLDQGGLLIQEGADNIDLNTETIDGKNTFHSMARAVFQTCQSRDSVSINQSRVERCKERSLEVSEKAANLSSCLQFNKPKQRCVPKRFPNAVEQIFDETMPLTKESEFLWVLLRCITREISCFPIHVTLDQFIPFWTGYNSSLTDYRPEFTVVSYAPIIDSKPSDMSTVFTTMKKCSDMTTAMGQKYSVQTFDQQLYAIGKQVALSMPETFDKHVLRLGGFHTLSCFIAAIGKLWGDGGLRDLLIDSSVYASGTADQMIAGKQFNRGVRGLTLVYEALSVLQMSAFFRWARSTETLQESVADEMWKQLLNFANDYGKVSDMDARVDELLRMISDHLTPLFETFRKNGCDQSKTFRYWDMFLRAVEILLNNIRSERIGDWNLHLASVSEMLPYFFSTNRMNYSRWLPVYILDMLNLPPDIKSAFDAGQFAIRQKPSRFNGIWSDMATEKTVIKDSKGTGGIVGMTQQKSSLLRWSLTRHVLADICSEMKSRSGCTYTDEMSHDETRKSTIKRDEEHTRLILDHIHFNMTDPFDTDQHPNSLINISTGMHATKEVESSLLGAVDSGLKMAKMFIKKNLNEGESGNFYNPIARSKLKTFEEMSKKIRLKVRSGEVLDVHINPELVFRRALILANSRDDVTVEKVLSFPIGPIPTSLFHDDGTMRKSCKADICHQLEAEVSSQQRIGAFEKSSTVLIRDGMALIQSLNVKKMKTFGELALQLIMMQKSCLASAGTVADVYDRYDMPNSIKSAERERRCQSSGRDKVFQIIEGRPIPDWKKFLGVVENKQSLLRFIGDFISNHLELFETLSDTDELYLAGIFSDPLFVRKITRDGLSECRELYSNQEEADTRIILHATHADKAFGMKNVKGRIIIKSPDTDVLILAAHFFPSFNHTSEMWFETGTVSDSKDGRRFIPVHELCKTLHPTFLKILPAAHALTGCDTTSSMFHIGKKTVYKVLKMSPETYGDLCLLGTSDIESSLPACRKLVAKLYDQTGKHIQAHSDLNKLRVRLATIKNASLARLPPCEATFEQHVLRAALQTYIWMSSQTPQPPPKSPFQFGWQQATGLVPVFFKGQMSSDFLQDLICFCKGKSVCGSNCVCFEQNLACTDLCPCQASEMCKNVNTKTNDDLDDDDIDPV